MSGRRFWLLLALLILGTALAPLLLRPRPPRPAPADAPAMRPIAVAPAQPLARAYERRLFAARSDASTMPEDAPELVGVVGRLGNDAVALVRAADGSSRTLAIGESVDGWRLESLAVDSAYFARGARRGRVAKPGAAADQ